MTHGRSAVSSTIKTDHHDILTEILLKMALNTITPTNQYELFMHIRSCWVPSLDKKTSKIVGIPFTVDRIINRRFSKF
jgi:hypothetical protein